MLLNWGNYLTNIKIDKVDNGYVVSYILPPKTSSLTGVEVSGPVQVVTVHTTFEELIKTLEKEFK